MPKCKSCGRPLSTLRGLYSIICKECEPSWPRVEAERKAAEAKAFIESEIEFCLKGEKYRGYGVAWWDTMGTAVSSVLEKATGAALFGRLGSQMTGKTHRLGVLVLTATKLYIIEMGDIVGEEVDSDTFLVRTGHGKATSYELKDVILQGTLPTKGITFTITKGKTLTILEPFQMIVTFPYSYAGNASNARLIETAIRADETNNLIIK